MFTKKVIEHYNNFDKISLEDRKKSKIIYLRNFNNWIKSIIINEFVSLSVNNNNNFNDGLKVLDIGCGKGGDLRKYLICGIKHLVCTDISENSLEECKIRYNLMKKSNQNKRRRNYLFSCEFILMDSTKETISKRLSNPKMMFDLTMIQFAFHYSFETIEQAVKLLKNASDNLKVGGYIVGTTVDANKVMKNTLNLNKLTYGNDLFSIEFPEEILKQEKVPLFGNKYNFKLHDVVDCPEFLVHFPTVVQLAKNFNLELYYCRRFEDYFLENFAQNEFLLKKINALKYYPLDEKEFDNEEELLKEYKTAETYLRKNPRLIIDEDVKIGTISESEWQAITMYIVFAFKKVHLISKSDDKKK